MTRTSTGTTAVARMGQPTRRHGTGSGYPLWMRTLEEKYQKLHKKITESTGAARFTNCVGRSVYDTRLSQALSKYKDITAVHKPPGTIGRAKSSKTGAIDATENEQFHLQSENVIEENLESQYLDTNATIEADNEQHSPVENGCENEAFTQNTAPLSTDANGVNITGHGLKESEVILDIDDEIEESLTDNDDADKNNRDKVLPDNLKAENHISFDNGKVDVHECDNDHVETPEHHNKYSRRNLKTSISRTSKVTSKSCPVKIPSHLAKNGHRQLLTNRSKSANRINKMFTPMSEEAKHAITETIHEMNVSTPREHRYMPTRGRQCVKSWVSPKKAKTNHDATRNVLERASNCLITNLNSDGIKIFEKMSINNDDSCNSSNGSLNEDSRRQNSRLPDIQNGSSRGRSAGQNKSYRLPGIGKYNIANEDPVFNITPPGFDSRYNDVTAVEERESETPPPDIRQRAIDKCSEWLTKYNK